MIDGGHSRYFVLDLEHTHVTLSLILSTLSATVKAALYCLGGTPASLVSKVFSTVQDVRVRHANSIQMQIFTWE